MTITTRNERTALELEHGKSIPASLERPFSATLAEPVPFVCAALAVHWPSQSRVDGVKLQRIGAALAVASAR